MKIIFKVFLVGLVVFFGYYFYVVRLSHPEGGADLLQQLRALQKNQRSDENNTESAESESSTRNATSDSTPNITTTQTTSLSTANFKVQKCVTPDGRVIYVDHVKAGQCKNITNETKVLTVAHTETEIVDKDDQQTHLQHQKETDTKK